MCVGCTFHGKSQQSCAHLRPTLHTDDIGWSDFGYFGFDLYGATPTIDTLASQGVKLACVYGQTACTPGRAAFLTGVCHHRIALRQSIVGKDLPSQYSYSYPSHSLLFILAPLRYDRSLCSTCFICLFFSIKTLCATVTAATSVLLNVAVREPTCTANKIMLSLAPLASTYCGLSSHPSMQLYTDHVTFICLRLFVIATCTICPIQDAILFVRASKRAPSVQRSVRASSRA